MKTAVKIDRLSDGVLRVDVSADAADKARVYTTEQAEQYALFVANACTLDVWRVVLLRRKRRSGGGSLGFVALLTLEV